MTILIPSMCAGISSLLIDSSMVAGYHGSRRNSSVIPVTLAWKRKDGPVRAPFHFEGSPTEHKNGCIKSLFVLPGDNSSCSDGG